MKGCLLLSGLLVMVALQIHAARLVAYYPLDGDLADKSGNGYDLRDSHPEDGRWTADRDENKNCAAQFNGERGHYLACDHSWAVTGNTTVAFWFKPKEPLHVASTISEDSTYMMFPVYGGSVNDDVVGIGVAGGTDGIAVREHKSQYLQTTFLYKKSLGTTWHHFAICTAKDKAAVYLDGVKLGLADANGFRKKIANGCSIGGGSYGSFKGCIDDVRYYDGTLNDLEVADLARRVRISDVSVFSGHPWKEVVIGYTITGCSDWESFLRVSLRDVQNDKNYAFCVLDKTSWAPGQHVIRWNAMTDGVTLKSSNAVVTLSLLPLQYCVIDLSAGASAKSYPVSYMEAMPEGSFAEEYKTTKLALRYIKAGSFSMQGTTPVTLTKPFYLGVFEVTQKQYQLIMGENPSRIKGDKRPVEGVVYDAIRGNVLGSQWPSGSSVDATSFLGKLRAKTGLNFDLPTEAQWEYACRAGTTTTYSYGNDEDGDYMWYSSNASSVTHDVGTKNPNQWGLYDMHGNVWEWCMDWFDTQISATGPNGPAIWSERVLRGGSVIYSTLPPNVMPTSPQPFSFKSGAQLCASSSRVGLSPKDVDGDSFRGFNLYGVEYHGFRLSMPIHISTSSRISQ